MNRYVAEGLIRDAERGLRVVVVTHPQDRREVLAAVEAELSDVRQPHTVRRANGRERIDFVTAGFIDFRSPGVSNRGVSADVLYVEGWNSLSDRARDEMIPMAARGELIRA